MLTITVETRGTLTEAIEKLRKVGYCPVRYIQTSGLPGICKTEILPLDVLPEDFPVATFFRSLPEDCPVVTFRFLAEWLKDQQEGIIDIRLEDWDVSDLIDVLPETIISLKVEWR